MPHLLLQHNRFLSALAAVDSSLAARSIPLQWAEQIRVKPASVGAAPNTKSSPARTEHALPPTSLSAPPPLAHHGSLQQRLWGIPSSAASAAAHLASFAARQAWISAEKTFSASPDFEFSWCCSVSSVSGTARAGCTLFREQNRLSKVSSLRSKCGP